MGVSELRNGREWIRAGEVCSLLHDLGKLSSHFIHYRRTWHLDPRGYYNDPHDHDFLTRYDSENGEKYPQLFECMRKERNFPELDAGLEKFSPAQVMTTHSRGSVGSVYEYALKAGDGIDAACDRNNPLPVNEQTDRRLSESQLRRSAFVYRSNVFGYEGPETRVTPEELDEARSTLYQELDSNKLLKQCWEGMPSAESRRKLLRILEHEFEPGLGDTTRPQNDTSLWEHAYGVTCVTKALQAWHLLYQPNRKPNGIKPWDFFAQAKLMLWGVGWDALTFLERSRRIRDLDARRRLLQEVRDHARDVIEHAHCLGNYIYKDDHCAVFLLPGVADDEQGKEFEDFLKGIEQCLLEETVKQSGAELWPRFCRSDHAPPREILHKLGDLLENLRGDATPWIVADGNQITDGSLEIATDYLKWEPNGKICSVCRMRPAEKADASGPVCDTCLKRRKKTDASLPAANLAGLPEPKPTVWVGEIADGHNCVALLACRVDLAPWLDGRMIRSLFVREPQGLNAEIAALGTLRQFEAEELRARQDILAIHDGGSYDWDRVRSEVAACLGGANPLADAVSFLYNRRWKDGKTIGSNADQDWRTFAGADLDESVSRLCAKTATPSTLLDVWRTTEEFFRSLSNDLVAPGPRWLGLVNHLVEKKRRPVLLVKTSQELREGMLHTAKYGGSAIEFIPQEAGAEGTPIEIITPVTLNWQRDKPIEDIRCGDTSIESAPIIGEGEPIEYLPFRELITTPEYCLILLPGEKAIEAADRIADRFQQWFGKVRGRLGLAVNVLFFDSQFPMPLALESARLLLRSSRARFGKNSATPRLIQHVERQPDRILIGFRDGGRQEFPVQLGDGRLDGHHPWAICRTPRGGLTVCVPGVGHAIHAGDLEAGMELLCAPEIFDFDYLDSSVARFRLTADKEGRRPRATAHPHRQSPPLSVQDLQQRIIPLFELLGRSGITDSALRGMLDQLDERRERWKIDLPLGTPVQGSEAEIWSQVAVALVETNFKSLEPESRQWILDRITEGHFFETTSIFLKILKHQLADEEAKP